MATWQKKRPGETRTYTFRFDKQPELKAGAKLTGTPVMAADVTGLTFGSPAIASTNDRVLVAISGGADGVTYNVTCRCPLDDGTSVLEVVGKIPVSAFG